MRFRYPDTSRDALTEVTLDIDEGTFALAVGPTGAGKSTLLRASNGLVPHFTGGTFRGRVTVDGRDTLEFPPRKLADAVAFVPQDPGASFVLDRVEDELAYGMENLGVDPAHMRRRVEETLDLLDIEPLRARSVRTLSGGERQRVAIAAALAAGPRILVLDEPTSQLDPQGAEHVVAALQRLVHDQGITVLLAEHRLERVAGFVDLALGFSDGHVEVGSSRGGDPPVGDGPAGGAPRTAGRLGPGAAHGARGAPDGSRADRRRWSPAGPGRRARPHARRTARRRGAARRRARVARHRSHDRPRRDRRRDGPQRRRQDHAAARDRRRARTVPWPRDGGRPRTPTRRRHRHVSAGARVDPVRRDRGRRGAHHAEGSRAWGPDPSRCSRPWASRTSPSVIHET